MRGIYEDKAMQFGLTDKLTAILLFLIKKNKPITNGSNKLTALLNQGRIAGETTAVFEAVVDNCVDLFINDSRDYPFPVTEIVNI